MSPTAASARDRSSQGPANKPVNDKRGQSCQAQATTAPSGISNEAEMTRRAKNNKKWHRRFKIVFCCLGLKKNKDSIADVASLFADFYADSDIFSTDLAAGFVLLSKYQAAQRKWMINSPETEVENFLSSVPITPKTKFLDISTADDSHLINDLIYYMNYSLAIFGWPLYTLENPCNLCCICPYLRPLTCCSGGSGHAKTSKAATSVKDSTSKTNVKENQQKKSSRKEKNASKNETKDNQLNQQQQINQQANSERDKPKEPLVGKLDENCDAPTILGDNCFGCNVASVECRLSAHNYEIIYVTYKDNINVIPFLVVADHSKRSVVVAVRGSMSLSDMVTDMNGQAEKLPMEDCPDDWLSHKGFNKAALYVQSMLVKERILDRAFNCSPDLGSQDYTLVLTGHSLGAGVAAILGIIMRKQYPTLRAFLYSPPGGCMTLPAVEQTKQFAVGVILGNDCIPRLGLAQLERLRYYTLLSLNSSQHSTGRILAKALCPTCCLGGNKVDYDPSLSLNVLHGTEGRPFDYNGTKIPFQVQTPVLYVPGRIIHIVKNYSYKPKARRLFNEPIYQAIWNENTEYDRVLISEGMLSDHLPHILMHSMKMLFCKTLPGRKESTESTIKEVKTVISIKESNQTQASQGNNHIALKVDNKLTIHNDSINDIHNTDGDYDENNNNTTAHAFIDKQSSDLKSARIDEYVGSIYRPVDDSLHVSSKSISGQLCNDPNGNEENVPNKNIA